MHLLRRALGDLLAKIHDHDAIGEAASRSPCRARPATRPCPRRVTGAVATRDVAFPQGAGRRRVHPAAAGVDGGKARARSPRHAADPTADRPPACRAPRRGQGATPGARIGQQTRFLGAIESQHGAQDAGMPGQMRPECDVLQHAAVGQQLHVLERARETHCGDAMRRQIAPTACRTGGRGRNSVAERH